MSLDVAHLLGLVIYEFLLILPLARPISRGRVPFSKDFLFWVSLVNLVILTVKSPGHLLVPLFLLQPNFLVGGATAEAFVSVAYKYSSLTLFIHSFYALFVILGFWFFLMLFNPLDKTSGYLREIKASKAFLWLTLVLFLFIVIGMGGISGILENFMNLSAGRLSARENIGLVLVISSVLPILLLVAGFLKRELLSIGWYRVCFLATIILQFLLGGSRSLFVFNIMLYFVTYFTVFKKINVLPASVLFLCVVFLTGIMGIARSTGGDFSDFSLAEGAELTYEEIGVRDINASTQVTEHVNSIGGFLLGESYVGAVLFFIPRSIWEGKPRGAGAYAASIINLGYADRFYTSASYPISAPAELYLNFWFFGVFFGGVLTGLIYALLSRFGGYSFRPLSFGIFLIGLLTLRGGLSSDAIIPFLQCAVLFLCFWWFLRVMRFGKQSS